MTAEGTASHYDTDILLWSERQANCCTAARPIRSDWDNLAEGRALTAITIMRRHRPDRRSAAA
jgi:hypothetical protein